tara:strand:+ start:248 stop:427 length:180 start_codon:yes stop_codon:yes gene_type:complete
VKVEKQKKRNTKGIYPNLAPDPLNKSLIDSLKALALKVVSIYKTCSLLKVSTINNPDFD